MDEQGELHAGDSAPLRPCTVLAEQSRGALQAYRQLHSSSSARVSLASHQAGTGAISQPCSGLPGALCEVEKSRAWWTQRQVTHKLHPLLGTRTAHFSAACRKTLWSCCPDVSTQLPQECPMWTPIAWYCPNRAFAGGRVQITASTISTAMHRGSLIPLIPLFPTLPCSLALE